MPKKGARRPIAVGDKEDPEGLYVWTRRYLQALQVKNYAERTIINLERSLVLFLEWCEARSLTRPNEITLPILERYQRHLFHSRKANGKPLTFRAQAARLVALRGWFRWLVRQGALLWNPASELELPRAPRRLPKHILTAAEVDMVLQQPDVTTPLGLRDRAILETFYSTGMRRAELVNLRIYDIDTERGTVMIRLGKGGKDRLIPIGDRALVWIAKYLDNVRPGLVMPPDEGVLFLTHFGEGFRRLPMTHLVRAYVDQAKLGKTGACHLFRHTMATLMLEGGADIRYIQAMLGHALLSTTQVYTHVSIRQLKHVHTTTHPAAALERRPVPEPDDDEGVDPDTMDPKDAPAVPEPTPEQLIRALADEDDDADDPEDDEDDKGSPAAP